MTLLLKSVKIVCPESPFHLQHRDLLIENGEISKIAKDIPSSKSIREVALQGIHVSIGWFDSGVCFGEPGFEERETIGHGLNVAAQNGYTDLVLQTDMQPIPDSGTHISSLIQKSNGRLTQLHPMGTLTRGGEGQHLAELHDMSSAGAVAFGDYKKSLSNANLFKVALQYAQNFDGLICSFPQDNDIAGKGVVHEDASAMKVGLRGIPSLAESLCIQRDLSLLEYTGGKLHIPTISTSEAVALIKDAKAKGLNVSCSVAIHHLALTDEKIKGYDSRYKLLPPLRTEADRTSLRQAVKEGIIDFVTADHSPIDIENKQVAFDQAAFGSIGLEGTFGILNHLFDYECAISLLTKGRTRYGIKEPKIAVGEPANLTLFHLDDLSVFGEKDIHSTSKNSALIGVPIKGTVYGSIRGKQSYIKDKSIT